MRGDIDPRHMRATVGQQHGVAARAASVVEDVKAADISEQVVAVFERVRRVGVRPIVTCEIPRTDAERVLRGQARFNRTSFDLRAPIAGVQAHRVLRAIPSLESWMLRPYPHGLWANWQLSIPVHLRGPDGFRTGRERAGERSREVSCPD